MFEAKAITRMEPRKSRKDFRRFSSEKILSMVAGLQGKVRKTIRMVKFVVVQP